MKVLFVTNAASFIVLFNMNNIRMLLDMGCEVQIATNFYEGNTCSPQRIQSMKETLDLWGVPYYQVNFGRSPLAIGKNTKAYKQLRDLANKEHYTFIHCHTPMGAVLARLVGRATHTKVMYTAHGFHFYTGAPAKNWLLYYPVEKFLARYTDMLVTINHEDYERAKKKLPAKEVTYIHGIGVDLNRFTDARLDQDEEGKQSLRASLGLHEGDKMLLSVGELIPRKNQESMVRALAKLNDPSIHYFVCGIGPLRESLEALAKELHMENNIHFLGFRNDINDLCHACDLYVFPSLQEGLPVALLEAVASAIPVVCSDIRGNNDLVLQPECRFAPTDADSIISTIQHGLTQDLTKAIEENYANVAPFAVEPVMAETKVLYQRMLDMSEENKR